MESDPDWIPSAPKKATKAPTFSVTDIQQKEWIKSIVRAANRARVSSDDLFFIFSDFFTAHGIKLEDIVFSPSTIADVRAEFVEEDAKKIKVSRE